MRTIKFRGKRVDNGEWVYGLLFFSHGTGVYKITCSNGWVPSYSNPDEGESTLYHDIHPESVGQFTGLLDRHGKEIFEGDILVQANREKVCASYLSGQLVGIRKNDTVSRSSFYWIYATIIGNIHES